MSGFARWQWVEAKRATEHAQRSEAEAKKQAQLAQTAEEKAREQARLAQRSEAEAKKQAQLAQTAKEKVREQAQLAQRSEAEAKKQTRIAQTAEEEARNKARRANSLKLAAQAIAHQRDQFDLALLLSLEACHTEDTPETHGSLLSTLNSNPQLSQFLRGHRDEVFGVAFSPDGGTLASASFDNTVLLWDVKTRTRRGAPLAGHTAAVTSVAFSPDGGTLASASFDHTVLLWDVKTRTRIGEPLDLPMPLQLQSARRLLLPGVQGVAQGRVGIGDHLPGAQRRSGMVSEALAAGSAAKSL